MKFNYKKRLITEYIPIFIFSVRFRVVLGQAYRGFIDGFLLLRIFSVGISVNPHVCFILDLILISLFLR